MKLDFYKPRNEILQKHIEGYYFISEDKKARNIKYFTFPNNYCILSVNRNAKVQLEDGKYFISSTADKNITADLVCRYTEPIEVIYKNAVDEITIYFKPLGINHFINTPNTFKQPVIADFDPFPDYKERMELIFRQPGRAIQIELLENYWLSKLKEKDLEDVRAMLTDIETDLKIEDIASKYDVSRKHINALFLKYTGKPPSEYRRIHRFRKTLLEYKKSKNLTTLSHGSFFYDQSHLIKDFRALTKTNPGLFFKNVNVEKENVWLFI